MKIVEFINKRYPLFWFKCITRGVLPPVLFSLGLLVGSGSGLASFFLSLLLFLVSAALFAGNIVDNIDEKLYMEWRKYCDSKG